jgi:hypothetical protein
MEKVCSIGEPNWIGLWTFHTTEIDDHSLFFMYETLNDNKEYIEGKIFDKFGMAFFMGKKGDSQIRFKKTYSSTSQKDAAKNPIEYLGTRNDKRDFYSGTWTMTKHEKGFGGNFILAPGDERSLECNNSLAEMLMKEGLDDLWRNLRILQKESPYIPVV